MPRIEFETSEHRKAFIDWLSTKVGREEAGFLERTKENHQTHTLYEIWMVNDEPLIIYRDARLDIGNTDSVNEALVSERHASELKTAGVIFDSKVDAVQAPERIRLTPFN